MRQSDDGSVRYPASPDHPNSPLQPSQTFVFVFVFAYLFSMLLLDNHTWLRLCERLLFSFFLFNLSELLLGSHWPRPHIDKVYSLLWRHCDPSVCCAASPSACLPTHMAQPVLTPDEKSQNCSSFIRLTFLFPWHLISCCLPKHWNPSILKYQFSPGNVKSYNWIASSIVTTLSGARWWDQHQTRRAKPFHNATDLKLRTVFFWIAFLRIMNWAPLWPEVP